MKNYQTPKCYGDLATDEQHDFKGNNTGFGLITRECRNCGLQESCYSSLSEGDNSITKWQFDGWAKWSQEIDEDD